LYCKLTLLIVLNLLLFFFRSKTELVVESGISEEVNDKTDSFSLAESCLRELIGRASFGHVKSVIRPVLK
jgi:Tfp pilus assembly protein PilX